MRKFLAVLFNRLTIMLISVAVQIVAMVFLVIYAQKIFIYSSVVLLLISAVVVLGILSSSSNPTFKLAIVMPILMFPIFGGIFYLALRNPKASRLEVENVERLNKNIMKYKENDTSVLQHMLEVDKTGAAHSNYLYEYGYAPVWENTEVKYFPLGEDKFSAMLEELKNAKYFIFLEYFIISTGKIWTSVLDILKAKVSEGVDVRLIYDDAGCALLLPNGYDKRLSSIGIKTMVFNKFTATPSLRVNNRDHRKICVIDGHIAFTGGINLADEYANITHPHGHWKDTAVMLRGEAVWNFTMVFISMWELLTGEKEDFSKYFPNRYAKFPKAEGFVQPFFDTPLDNEYVSESIYLNMINKAKDYIYITTPYLIIDNNLITALSLAAKNGVDIRIITPHIPDKWYVHEVTRSHYAQLVSVGVKIYEYTPGFIHAKGCVSDDKYAIVGTINMDYRSLYFHFECGVFICQSSIVKEIKSDFFDTLQKSKELTYSECVGVNPIARIFRSILKIFSPLM